MAATTRRKASATQIRGSGPFTVRYEVDYVGGGCSSLSTRFQGDTTLDQLMDRIREEADTHCKRERKEMERIDELVQVWTG